MEVYWVLKERISFFFFLLWKNICQEWTCVYASQQIWVFLPVLGKEAGRTAPRDVPQPNHFCLANWEQMQCQVNKLLAISFKQWGQLDNIWTGKWAYSSNLSCILKKKKKKMFNRQDNLFVSLFLAVHLVLLWRKCWVLHRDWPSMDSFWRLQRTKGSTEP